MIAILAGAFALAGAAHGEATSTGAILVGNDFSAPGFVAAPTTTGRALEWDSKKGRWGLKLGVEQHNDHFSEWRDVQSGVYFRITPRLHIGGSISLSPDPTPNERLMDPQTTAPKVRLETTFKF